MSYNLTSEYIDEIVLNILTRLPIKSLSRFKCVSKIWNYAISHPNFLKRDSFFFTLRYKYHSIYSVDNQPLIYSHPLPWFKYHSAHVANSCNGLLLIHLQNNLFLFNPWTNYFVKVLNLNSRWIKDNIIIAGFCYDYSINEYKAVLGHVHRFNPDHDPEFVIVVSLRTKRWEQVPFRFNIRSVVKGPVVNGRMHWTVQDLRFDNETQTIIHFDSRSNAFEELLMPKQNDVNAIVGLGVLDGQLCMARGGEMGEDDVFGSIEVMVMKEYGVVESWTTLFVVSNVNLMVNCFGGKLTPLSFAKNGEVFFNIDDKKLVLYNPGTDSYKNVDIESLKKKRQYPICIEAVPSDVSVVTPKGCKWSRRKHRRLWRKFKGLGLRIRRNNHDWDSDYSDWYSDWDSEYGGLSSDSDG